MKQRMTTCFAPRKKMVVRVSLKKGWRTVVRTIECKVNHLFLHFQKILSFSNEGKNDFLTLNAISWFILLNINTLCCVLLICHPSVNLSICQPVKGGGFL